MYGKRVLSVGQCSYDHGNISRLLHKQFSAEVVPAATSQEAMSLLRKGGVALVLVNRVFDASGEGGLDFIRQVKADHDLRDLPVMLVSNFPEAQDEAAAAGAVPGFGKSSLHEIATTDRLRPYLS